MKVLIVEDAQSKAGALRGAVESAGMHAEDVITVPDATEARTKLQTESYDILLLDLQIPTRFGDGPTKSGGADLLRALARRTPGRLPAHILAVTSFEIEEATAQQLCELGVSVLTYAPSNESWKTHIRGLVRRVRRSVSGDGPVAAPEPISAVVLTTVDVESDQVRRVFEMGGGGEIRAGLRWHRGVVAGRLVVHAQASQMGMPAAAVLANKAIRLWNPSALLMAGVCAGVKGEVNLGDLVVPDPCWDYGSGKLGKDGLLRPDPRAISLQETLRVVVQAGREQADLVGWRDAWSAAKPQTVPRVHVGPAVSGAAVIADGTTTEEIKRQSRKVIGIDMENYGVYFACANSGLEVGPRFCAVKGVVDFADPEKADAVHEYAAHMSARFTRWLVENL
ncbi:MAG: response regulator [Myxococcota bacterium]